MNTKYSMKIKNAVKQSRVEPIVWIREALSATQFLTQHLIKKWRDVKTSAIIFKIADFSSFDMHRMRTFAVFTKLVM